MSVSDELRRQVEAAFDHRGHVTVTFKDGRTLEGFVSNRAFESGGGGREFFIDFFRQGADEKETFDLSAIASIELTGKDHAESYEDGLKRTRGAKLDD